jgi:enoyl-CoA hydratase/carnithine racemase
MSAELVISRRDDAIVHVVLSRPEKHNTLNREVLRAGVPVIAAMHRYVPGR